MRRMVPVRNMGSFRFGGGHGGGSGVSAPPIILRPREESGKGSWGGWVDRGRLGSYRPFSLVGHSRSDARRSASMPAPPGTIPGLPGPFPMDPAGVGEWMSGPDHSRPFRPGARDNPSSAWRVCMRSILLSTLLLATLLSGMDRSTPLHPPSALDVAADTDSLAPVLHPPSPVLLSGGFGETGAQGSQPAPHRVQRDRLLSEGAQVVDAPGGRPQGAHPAGHPSPGLQPRPPPVSLRIA